MSSEPEETGDHLDESNANSSTVEVNQSFDEKDNGLNEHAKPRRRRRGKKRKHKKESAATCETQDHNVCESEMHAESEHENHVDCESPNWDSEEHLSCDNFEFTDVIIRPINVPKAPENSTQFIMDDHNDCHFYMSFETPNPYLADPPRTYGDEDDIIEPVGSDPAYRDIDYQYESPQDFDNSAYYDAEFERSYKNNRYDELMRHSRTDLISAVQDLESRYKEISDALVKQNPSPILEKLQAQLLTLQEENNYLKESNTKLNSILRKNESVNVGKKKSTEMLPQNSSPSVSPDPEFCGEISYKDSSPRVQKSANSSPTLSVYYRDLNSDIHVLENFSPPDSPVLDSPEEDFDPEAFPDSSPPVPDCHKDNGCEEHEETGEVVVSMSEENIPSETCDKNYHSSPSSHTLGDQLLSETDMKYATNNITVNNSGDQHVKINNTNTSVHHCQPNSIVKDELRTLSVNNSDLFHIAKQTKCSSAVPIEGSMSPSETSVN